MATGFGFNAPQYFDFGQQQDEDNVDSYFEESHESDAALHNGSVTETMSDGDDKLEFGTPMEVPLESNARIYLGNQVKRRSRSVDNIRRENHDDVSDVSRAFNSLNLMAWTKLKQKTVSQESIDRLAQPKKKVDNSSKSDYVSLAEAVTKFQSKTPARYRSNPNLNLIFKPPALPHYTKPQSPKLVTKQRARPTYAISTAEQEELDFKDAQKFKIKANPVPHKILREPFVAKIPVESKPATIPEPFNLTVAEKKVAEPPVEEYTFHAKPIPKTTHEPAKLVPVKAQPTTVATTPTCMKRGTRPSPVVAKSKRVSHTPPKNFIPRRTEPIPFSFETRQEAARKRREELLNKILEEEKKAREFRARPPPANVLRSRTNSIDDMTSPHHKPRHVVKKPPSPAFKARPPLVLTKKPFQPKKTETLNVEIKEFNLVSDQRAKERMEFEKRIKDKEAHLERFKQQIEEETLRLEEEEKAKLRKAAEVKAQPIKKYKPVPVIPPAKLTEPISPKFHTDMIRNKENVIKN